MSGYPYTFTCWHCGRDTVVDVHDDFGRGYKIWRVQANRILSKEQYTFFEVCCDRCENLFIDRRKPQNDTNTKNS